MNLSKHDFPRNPLSVENTPTFAHLEKNKQDDLFLLSVVDQQIQGVLEQINYIAITLKTNKKVPVEDMSQKIKKALQKIKSYLNEDPSAKQEADLGPNQSPAGGIQLENNPLIDDLGGMPLESISGEWQDLVEEFSNILDKAEIENLIKNKLKDKLENRERLANRLKIGAKLKNVAKPGVAMTPKFKQIEQTVKFILKEMPAPPAPAPRETPLPRPRPTGF